VGGTSLVRVLLPPTTGHDGDVTPITVTISATFGTGAVAIGHAIADRLGLPLVDRVIPQLVAAEIGCSFAEVLTHDDQAESGLARLLVGAAQLPNITFGGMDVYLPDRTLVPEEKFVVCTERAIREIARERGGVILGRAAALVLADHPQALHVRLDGPRERRLAQVAAEFGIGEKAAQRMLNDNDRSRAAYVKHFYRVDPASPRLYHLVIDSTRLPERACVDLIVSAARWGGGQAGADPT
jgi:cytidylate kinase